MRQISWILREARRETFTDGRIDIAQKRSVCDADPNGSTRRAATPPPLSLPPTQTQPPAPIANPTDNAPASAGNSQDNAGVAEAQDQDPTPPVTQIATSNLQQQYTSNNAAAATMDPNTPLQPVAVAIQHQRGAMPAADSLPMLHIPRGPNGPPVCKAPPASLIAVMDPDSRVQLRQMLASSMPSGQPHQCSRPHP